MNLESKKRRRCDWQCGLVALATVIVMVAWSFIPSGAVIEKDAYQNLVMAYNLAHHGVMSMDDDPARESLRPSRYREPLPVWTLAAQLSLSGKLSDRPLAELLQGHNAMLLKFSNLYWGLLLLGVVIVTVLRMTGSKPMAALAVLLSYWPLSNNFDELYTEVSGATLLALTSYLCWRAAQDGRAKHFFLAGLAFGALTLTKASFLYVAIALIAIYAFYGLVAARGRADKPPVLRALVLTLAGTLLVIAPWMLRNQIYFGSPQISDRGGLVLITRAFKNGMTAEEYRGAFYVYAPYVLRRPIGFLTGFQPRDLEAGGRLERLRRRANPADDAAADEGRIDDVVSYYYRAKATRTPILAELNAADHPNALAAADAQLQNMAIDMIKADPLKHLAMTVPFMYRGAMFMFPFFCIVLIYAWRRRDGPLAGYVLPSLGLIGFYAMVSHFIPRYADPSGPVVAVCLALLLHRWLEKRKSG